MAGLRRGAALYLHRLGCRCARPSRGVFGVVGEVAFRARDREDVFERAGSTEGTLYLPSASQRVPAVVAFHAAGTSTRDVALFRHLEQMLPPLGVAVFVYDRRGRGKSVGKPAHGDYELLAEDRLSAVRMLAQDPRIDPRRIGVWGLSQGGWLSLLAAARSAEIAFAISVSAPLTTPDVQMNFAVANILRIKGYSKADVDAAIAAREAVDDFQRGKLDRATAQNAWTKPRPSHGST